ncbi:hypothetical protein F5141DRAFT_1135678 [Pisolithus sp. B1]|nr:hypothetical protein F5141DRAFT_1135678 [Pisolithus sp. B1]
MRVAFSQFRSSAALALLTKVAKLTRPRATSSELSSGVVASGGVRAPCYTPCRCMSRGEFMPSTIPGMKQLSRATGDTRELKALSICIHILQGSTFLLDRRRTLNF